MRHKILIMGLPGSGKTTLAMALARRLNAVHFNADEIRQNINKDLSFTIEDRIEQSRRLGWLCDRVASTGAFAIADFICPTQETRGAFAEGGNFTLIWVDRISKGRFEDTNKIFEAPTSFAVRVTSDGSPEFWAERIASVVLPVFDFKRPTALFVGRYQPFHDGHKALITEGIRRVGQVCIAVRDTTGLDKKNPFCFEYVKASIETRLRASEGQFTIIRLPNITNVFYGRDVGYGIERIELDSDLEAISATGIRKLMLKEVMET